MAGVYYVVTLATQGFFPPFWCKCKLFTLKNPGFHAPLVLKTLLHGTKVPKLASRACARANSQVGAPSQDLARAKSGLGAPTCDLARAECPPTDQTIDLNWSLGRATGPCVGMGTDVEARHRHGQLGLKVPSGSSWEGGAQHQWQSPMQRPLMPGSSRVDDDNQSAYHCCHWKFRPSPALAHLARRKHCSIFFLLMCKRL